MEQKIIRTLRALSVDMIEAANSGHPGFPLGAAPLMYTVWHDFLNYNPANPQWANRDRFVLSAGHGSALYYAMLHLSGFDLPLSELRRFRQRGSRTPGHPEYGHTAGVETTSGPLGQGFATGIGMAVAERMLAAHYNRPGYDIINHYVYGIVSDGDLMEGVAAEAASLAGTLGLGKIIYLYDDNKITIEGSTGLAFTENVQARFAAYGWHTVQVDDAENIDGLRAAIQAARQETGRPSLILVRTHIGFASPKQDTAAAHGEPLGKEAAARTKAALGAAAEPFSVAADIIEYYAAKNKLLAQTEAAWDTMFAAYQKDYPEPAAELLRRWRGDFTLDEDFFAEGFAGTKTCATRDASGLVLQKTAELLPALCGGSADLGPSNKTYINGVGDFSQANPAGRNIHFGVREQAMANIANGMALHGGCLPYCATFLVFADFLRPAVRAAALMGLHVIFVFTHDSVAVGEDGPTHQPVEQTMSLRLIPGLTVLRPADALETVEAWRLAVNSRKPAALVLTRQKLPVLHEVCTAIRTGAEKGGYIIQGETSGRPDIILLATGSEVALALAAREKLAAVTVDARVVSLLSWEIFAGQEAGYREQVIPRDIPVLAMEAGRSLGWSDYTGRADRVLAVDDFGFSAPGGEVYEAMGFTVDNVVQKARQILGR